MELVNENCKLLKEIYLILKDLLLFWKFQITQTVFYFVPSLFLSLSLSLSLSLQAPDPNLTLALNNTGVQRLMSLRAGVKRTNKV